jgi:hypothetical protein
MVKSRNCPHCEYYETGPLDRHVNWMSCAKGHRLIADEQYIEEHYPFDDPDEKAVPVTWDGWTETGGNGQPMLDQGNCYDWQRRSFKFNFFFGKSSSI